MSLLWMVRCPDCTRTGMKKLIKNWKCLSCNSKFSDAEVTENWEKIKRANPEAREEETSVIDVS